MRLLSRHSLWSYIDLKYVVLGIIIGILLLWVFNGEKRKITVYPTPTNASRVEYVDLADNCFIHNAKETTCDGNEVPIPASVGGGGTGAKASAGTGAGSGNRIGIFSW